MWFKNIVRGYLKLLKYIIILKYDNMPIIFLIQSTGYSTNNNNIKIISIISKVDKTSLLIILIIQYDLTPSITVTHQLSHTVQQSVIHLPTFFSKNIYWLSIFTLFVHLGVYFRYAMNLWIILIKEEIILIHFPDEKKKFTQPIWTQWTY